MADAITISLLGEPVPWARSRHRGDQHYTPVKQRNTMAALRVAAQQEMLHANYGRAVLSGPLRVDMLAEFAIPKSWPKVRRRAALAQAVLPAKRPDIDNLYKLVADSLNTVVFGDDAQIVDLRVRKVYGVQPKIVVSITPLLAA